MSGRRRYHSDKIWKIRNKHTDKQILSEHGIGGTRLGSPLLGQQQLLKLVCVCVCVRVCVRRVDLYITYTNHM